jgi:hypothetical protein
VIPVQLVQLEQRALRLVAHPLVLRQAAQLQLEQNELVELLLLVALQQLVAQELQVEQPPSQLLAVAHQALVEMAAKAAVGAEAASITRHLLIAWRRTV